jgi:hypothetical protein
MASHGTAVGTGLIQLQMAAAKGGPVGGGAGSGSTSGSPSAYERPSNATTPEQRESVQGKPCVTCGETAPRMNADHIDPLVEEYYRNNGQIDETKMRDVNSVQPQCPTCSNRQGGFLSGFGRAMRRLFGL